MESSTFTSNTSSSGNLSARSVTNESESASFEVELKASFGTDTNYTAVVTDVESASSVAPPDYGQDDDDDDHDDDHDDNDNDYDNDNANNHDDDDDDDDDNL